MLVISAYLHSLLESKKSFQVKITLDQLKVAADKVGVPNKEMRTPRILSDPSYPAVLFGEGPADQTKGLWFLHYPVFLMESRGGKKHNQALVEIELDLNIADGKPVLKEKWDLKFPVGGYEREDLKTEVRLLRGISELGFIGEKNWPVKEEDLVVVPDDIGVILADKIVWHTTDRYNSDEYSFKTRGYILTRQELKLYLPMCVLDAQRAINAVPDEGFDRTIEFCSVQKTYHTTKEEATNRLRELQKRIEDILQSL